MTRAGWTEISLIIWLALGLFITALVFVSKGGMGWLDGLWR